MRLKGGNSKLSMGLSCDGKREAFGQVKMESESRPSVRGANEAQDFDSLNDDVSALLLD